MNTNNNNNDVQSTVVKKKKKSLKACNFSSTSVQIDKKFVTIKFPAKIAEYLELENDKPIFWSPVNGVIQISGNRPHMVIPMMNVSVHDFIGQQ